MTHATWNAIQQILLESGPNEAEMADGHLAFLAGEIPQYASHHAACDPRITNLNTPTLAQTAFMMVDGWSLVEGHSPERGLPSCPACADLCDLALSIRAEAVQARAEAEMDAERARSLADATT